MLEGTEYNTLTMFMSQNMSYSSSNSWLSLKRQNLFRREEVNIKPDAILRNMIFKESSEETDIFLSLF